MCKQAAAIGNVCKRWVACRNGQWEGTHRTVMANIITEVHLPGNVREYSGPHLLVSTGDMFQDPPVDVLH